MNTSKWTIKHTRTSKVFSHRIILTKDYSGVASIERSADDNQNEATARLVAKAPELVDAIKDMLFALDTDKLKEIAEEAGYTVELFLLARANAERLVNEIESAS